MITHDKNPVHHRVDGLENNVINIVITKAVHHRVDGLENFENLDNYHH